MGIKTGTQVLLLLVFSLVAACGPDSTAGEEEVREIPLEGSFGHADLIRIPLTAAGAEGPRAELALGQPEYAFGEVTEGAIVAHAFPIHNVGAVPLLITDARATCGCTVPRWPSRPIAPGETDTVYVRFNTAGRTGPQRKTITLTANTLPAEHTLAIYGFVKESHNQ